MDVKFIMRPSSVYCSCVSDVNTGTLIDFPDGGLVSRMLAGGYYTFESLRTPIIILKILTKDTS